MKALPLIRRRVVLATDAFAEVVVWHFLDELEPLAFVDPPCGVEHVVRPQREGVVPGLDRERDAGPDEFPPDPRPALLSTPAPRESP